MTHRHVPEPAFPGANLSLSRAQPRGPARLRSTGAGRHRLARDLGATTSLEFAILSVPFFLLLLFIFELSYDLYTQEALDAALHVAVRQIQTGRAQNLASGSDFVANYLCPAARGLLECGTHMYVKVTRIAFTGNQDFYDWTDGKIPVAGNALDLAGGGYVTSGGADTFCNSQPGQAILVSVLYLGPSFIGGILPKILSVTSNGATVHATLSTTGGVTEFFPLAAPGQGATPAAPC